MLSYFVANISKTLHMNFYQKRSSIVDVMTKNVGVFLWPTVYSCGMQSLPGCKVTVLQLVVRSSSVVANL